MADGNVSAKGHCITLSLQKDDRRLVEALVIFFDTDAPLTERVFGNRPGQNKSEQVAVSLYSEVLAGSLIRCGCVPRKTFIKEFPQPDIVPESLQGAFLRGYFDGNGCVGGRKSRKGITVTFSTGSQAFAFGISETLAKQGVVLSVRAYNNGKIFTVATEKKTNVLRIYHYLYDNATVYLDRKKEHFDELLKTK